MSEYLIWRCKCGSITAGGVAGMDPKGDHEFLRDHPGAEYVSEAPLLRRCKCNNSADDMKARAEVQEMRGNRLDEELHQVKGKLAAAEAKVAEEERRADSLADLCGNFERLWKDEIEKKRDAMALADRLGEAIDAAAHELGIPQPGYPAPVANASEILRAALAEWRRARKEKP